MKIFGRAKLQGFKLCMNRFKNLFFHNYLFSSVYSDMSHFIFVHLRLNYHIQATRSQLKERTLTLAEEESAKESSLNQKLSEEENEAEFVQSCIEALERKNDQLSSAIERRTVERENVASNFYSLQDQGSRLLLLYCTY